MTQMSKFERDERAYYDAYYKGAIGLTIVGVEWPSTVDLGDGATHNLDYYEQMPVLVATNAAGERFELAISRDPEGNGPGFLFGLPEPKRKDS